MFDMAVGDIFDLNLARIFILNFHEALKGTPEYGEARLTYGSVTWISDSDADLPGVGQDFYDWKALPFGRIPSDNGWLNLQIVEIDEDEQWIDCSVIGWYGLPHVRLSFDEFDYYVLHGD